jgi:chemotaxis protein methyltransferase CheR
MAEAQHPGFSLEAIRIRDDEFELFRHLIHEATGISLSTQKRQLLCSRLGKRLRHHGLETFHEYYEYLASRDASGDERRHLINAVTTNKTEFFRELHHFDFLRSTLVPKLVARAARGEPRRVRIWSAGCSSGEEPYSIAMLLADALPDFENWDVKILASDIDTDILERASNAIYPESLIAPVPASMRHSSFEAHGEHGGHRVTRKLRDLVKFRQINLIEGSWPIRTHFDVIFCRNVTIYFNRATQEKLYEHFTRYLLPQGYFIAGHSENLHWLSHLFAAVGNTIYTLNPALKGKQSLHPRSNQSLHPPRKHSLRPPSKQSLNPPRKHSLRAPSKQSLHPRARALPPSPPKRHSIKPARVASLRPRRHDSLSIERSLDKDVKRGSIQSGEVWSSDEPSLVSTVLGSCVAACLFDPTAAIGGMNHFMLPEAPEGSLTAAAYGSNAMEILINELMNLGARRDRLKAKLFGGAHVLKNLKQGLKVADSNAAFAKEYLVREGIAIAGERLGGDSPLQVHFFTHTGKVLLRTVRGKEAIAEHDLSYRKELTLRMTLPPPTDVTLF